MTTLRKPIILAALAVVLAGSGYVGFDRWVLNQGLPDGLIQANGRIEGDHVTVASKFPGRVQELLVREGATVTQGQVLIRLDDSQTAARVQQAKHAAEMFEAQVQAAHTTLAILNLDVPLAIERAEAQVGMMTLLVVAPMLLLSGIFTPLETMPAWVRYLMALSPLRYFIEIATGILLKGIGLEMLWSQALSMVALGVSLFGFGMWRFRRQFR